MAQLFGGADGSLAPRFLFGRGSPPLGRRDMRSDFLGFDEIDLTGFQVTAGVRVRF